MINFGKVVESEVTEIVSILDDVRETSSTTAKQAILKNNVDNEGLQTILELTYNPFKRYKITEKSLEQGTGMSKFSNLKGLTHTLANNNINDDFRREVNNFLAETDEEIRDLYKGVLLKDLKLGVNASTINKIWKGLIPTSDDGTIIKPMLANKFDLAKPPKGEFVVTEKLDGIRCVAIVRNEGVQLFTRQGKLIEGCLQIEQDLIQLRDRVGCEFMLDGEILATGCSYENVYKETTKRIKNKNEVKTGVKYVVFDMMDIKEFDNQKCETAYEKRLDTLFHFEISSMRFLNNIELIDILYSGDDLDKLMELLEEFRQRGAEGLMLNLLDAPYEFKRSKAILKVKVMQTCDLKIIGFEEGQGRNEGRLGALIVDYKGFECGVGSGFTDYEREFIWKNRDMHLGRICEIQYFEESKNKDGGVSLRFPVFKFMRLDKSEPSYY